MLNWNNEKEHIINLIIDEDIIRPEKNILRDNEGNKTCRDGVRHFIWVL
jgi:hypothetical protein